MKNDLEECTIEIEEGYFEIKRNTEANIYMGKSILIVESRGNRRKKIKMVFTEDRRVSTIYEAVTQEECLSMLLSHHIDLVIINQLLMTDKIIFSKGNIVILVAKPNLVDLQIAFKHGACAYLQENISAALLRSTLDLKDQAFLMEPSLSAYFLEDNNI